MCRICADPTHKADTCKHVDAVPCPECGWKVHKDSIECVNYRCKSRAPKQKTRPQAKLAWDRGSRPSKPSPSPDMSELMSRMQEGFDRVHLSIKKVKSKVRKVSSHVKKVDRELNGSDEEGDSDESG